MHEAAFCAAAGPREQFPTGGKRGHTSGVGGGVGVVCVGGGRGLRVWWVCTACGAHLQQHLQLRGAEMGLVLQVLQHLSLPHLACGGRCGGEGRQCSMLGGGRKVSMLGSWGARRAQPARMARVIGPIA